jgi:hypothetical protein
LMWLRTKTNGGLLWTRYESSGSTKCRELLDQLGNQVFQGLCSMELVISWRVVRRKHNTGIVELSKKELNP